MMLLRRFRQLLAAMMLSLSLFWYYCAPFWCHADDAASMMIHAAVMLAGDYAITLSPLLPPFWCRWYYAAIDAAYYYYLLPLPCRFHYAWCFIMLYWCRYAILLTRRFDIDAAFIDAIYCRHYYAAYDIYLFRCHWCHFHWAPFSLLPSLPLCLMPPLLMLLWCDAAYWYWLRFDMASSSLMPSIDISLFSFHYAYFRLLMPLSFILYFLLSIYFSSLRCWLLSAFFAISSDAFASTLILRWYLFSSFIIW